MTYLRNETICRECGACVADCSPILNGLMASDGSSVDPGSSGCEGCGHCFSVCPHGAIETDGGYLDAVPQLAVESLPSCESLFHLFTMRRSERLFAPRDVEGEQLAILTSVAAQIPSGGNRRAIFCSLLSADDRRAGLIREMGRFYRRLGRIVGSPLTRWIAAAIGGRAAGAFMMDPEYRRRFISMVEAIESGRDPFFYGAPVVFLFHTDALIPTPEEDAVLAAYNVALTAPTLGLGSCFVSMAQKAIQASKAVHGATGLPRRHRVLAVLALGYPAVERRRPVVRPPLPAQVVESRHVVVKDPREGT